MKIVPITAEHVAAVGGEPIPVTLIGGVAVVEDDKCLGIGCIFLGEGCQVVASRITIEGRRLLAAGRGHRELLRAARATMAAAATRNLPTYAQADTNIEGACRLLLHLGFVPYQRGIYQWQTP